MYICECGREFTTPNGLGYHKNHCGKLGIDNGYQYRIGNDGETIYIHREVMEQKLGRKLRPGELVHHEDENKLNNNPNNLKLTNRSLHGKTHITDLKINNLKIHRKVAIGSKVSTAKLTEDEVKEIKYLIRQSKLTIKQIANMFNASGSMIQDIKSEKTWKHIE